MQMWTSKMICDEFQISYRQLDFWCTKGYLRPDNESEAGSGVPRRFSPEELAVVRRMVALVGEGVVPATAARCARLDLETVRRLDSALSACRIAAQMRGVAASVTLDGRSQDIVRDARYCL